MPSAMAYMPPGMNHTPYRSSISGMIMYSEGPSYGEMPM